jgi:hypothetical protein
LLDKEEVQDITPEELLRLQEEAENLTAVRDRHIDANGRAKTTEAYAYFPPDGSDFIPLDVAYGRKLSQHVLHTIPENLRLTILDLSGLKIEDPVIVHADAYKTVKDYVSKCPVMSAEFLHAKRGFSEEEAKAIFEQLQADGVVAKEYTKEYGFKVLSRNEKTASPVERRNRKFGLRALRGTIEPAPALHTPTEGERTWETNRQQKLIVTTDPELLEHYFETQRQKNEAIQEKIAERQSRVRIVRDAAAARAGSGDREPGHAGSPMRPTATESDKHTSASDSTEAPTYNLSAEDATNEDVKALFKPHNLKRLSDDIAEEIRSDVTAYKKSNGMEQSIQLDDPVFAVIRDAAKQRVLESTIMNATKAPNANQETVDGLRDAQYEYDLGRKRNAKRKR